MDNTNLNPPRLRIWDRMARRFGIVKIVGLGVGALLLAVSVGVAVVFPNFRGDLRQRANEDRYGITDNLCHLPGANCTTDEDWQKGHAAARGDEKAAQQLEQGGHIEVNDQGNATSVDQSVVVTTAPPPPVESTPTTIERYGVTDNLCHLPGANCVTDEDWRKGNAAARGDKKATQELADTGHLKIDEGGNAVAVTQNVNPTSENVAATGGSSNTNNSQVSDAAKNAMDGYLKNNVGGVVVNGCNVNLGLCPMVDPTSGALVGWVPSDKPVFGTFEQAGIARQNLSIGDLFVDDVKLSDGKEIDRVYNYNWQDKKPEELGALITDPGKIAEIKALAEKNKVQVDEMGNVMTNQNGDLVLKDGGTLSKEKFDQAAKQFAIDQENKQKEIIASVQDGASKLITECANDPKCSKDELLNKFGGLDLLPKETRDTLMNSVADSYKKTVEEVEKVKKENQAAIKQNTEFYAGATRDQLANQCDKISNAQERLDCGRDPETYVLGLLGITSKEDVDVAVAKRKTEALKVERELRAISLNAEKFANAKSVEDLAAKLCEGVTGTFFGPCYEAEKKKLLDKGIENSSLIASIKDQTVKDALIVQFNANVKADNAAQAFQGVKPSDFPDLDKLVAQKIADNLIRKKNNGCGVVMNLPQGSCDDLTEQQAIALVVKEKQDQVYKDKCAELAGSNAFLSCGTPDLAKQYLVTVMNPDLSQDKAKELAAKLDPSFDTAAQLAADNQYKSWKNFDTAKGVVGGLSADVAALIWNPLSAVGNTVTGNWYNSHKDFMSINNPLEVDQNALKIKAQEEVVKKLYSDSNSVYKNDEKASELRVAEKYGFLNDPKILADAKKRVDSGASTWASEEQNYERLKYDPATSAVLNWNEWTTGRFKRGNDVLMEGQRTGDLKKIILGSVTQGGDAAALVTAVITAPIGGAIMGVGGGAIVGTGILGAAVSTQMTGQAADVCSQVGGATTQKQCIETSVLAATSWVGMGTSVANQAVALTRTAAQAGTLSKIGGLTQAVGKAAGSTVGQGVVTATQVASQGVGAVNFSSMAQGACNQAKDIHCTALATMALANVVGFGSGFTNAALNTNADKIAELAAGGAALTNVQKAIVNTNNVSTYLHKASAATFVASACGGMFEMGGGHINLDSVSMCGMALHGGIEAAKGHPVASKQQENIAKGLEGKIGAEAGKGGGPEVRTAAGVDAEIVKLKADLKAAAEAEGVRVRTTDGKLDGRFNVSDKPALVEMNNRLDALNAERSRLQVAEANAPVQTVAQTPVVAKKSGNPVVDFVSGLFNRGNAIDKIATQTLKDAQTAEKTATEKQKVAVTEANKARAERDRLSALADATTETAVAKIDSLDRELIKLSKTLDSSKPTEVVAAVENLPTDFKTKNSSAVEKVKDLAKQNEALDQQVAAGNISAADAAKNPARSQLKNAVADLNKTISTSKSEVSSEKVKLENLRAEALKTPDLLSKLGEANRILFEKNSAQLNVEKVVTEAKTKTAKAVENSKIPSDTAAIPRLSLWDSIFGKGTGKAAIAEKAPTVETPAEALKRTTAAEKLANDNQTKTAKEAEAARTERNRLKNLSDALDTTKINQLDATAQKLGAKLNAAEPFATEKVLSDLPVDFRTANREEVIKALDQVQRVKEAGTDAARELATKNLSQTLESLGKKMEAKRVETLAEKRTLDNLRDQASKITDLPAQLSKAEANLVDKLGKVTTMEREAIVAKEEVAKAKVSVETQAAANPKSTNPISSFFSGLFKGSSKTTTIAEKAPTVETPAEALKRTTAAEKTAIEKQKTAVKEAEAAKKELDRLTVLNDAQSKKGDAKLTALDTEAQKLRVKLEAISPETTAIALDGLPADFVSNNFKEIKTAREQIEKVRLADRAGDTKAGDAAVKELAKTVDFLNKSLETFRNEKLAEKRQLENLRAEAAKIENLPEKREAARLASFNKDNAKIYADRDVIAAKETVAKAVEVSKIPTDTAAIPKLSWLDILLGKSAEKTNVETVAKTEKAIEKPLTLDEVKQQIEAKKQEILENQKLSDEGGMTGLDRADTLQREIEVLRAQEKELLRLAGVGSSLEKVKNETSALVDKVAEQRRAIETVEGKIEDGGVIDSMKSDLVLMEAELTGLQAREKELTDIAGNSGKIDRASKTRQQKIDSLNKEISDLRVVTESKKLETVTGELEKATLEYKTAAEALGDNFQKEYDVAAKDLKLSNAKDIADAQQSIVKSLESQVKNFEKLVELAGKDPNADAVVVRRRAELETARQELDARYREYRNLEEKVTATAYDKVKQAVGNSDIEVLNTRKLTVEENVRKATSELNQAKDELTSRELDLVKEQAKKADIDNLKDYLPKNGILDGIKRLINWGDANKGQTTIYEQTAGTALTLSVTNQAQNSWWNNLYDSIFNRNKVVVPVSSIDGRAKTDSFYQQVTTEKVEVIDTQRGMGVSRATIETEPFVTKSSELPDNRFWLYKLFSKDSPVVKFFAKLSPEHGRAVVDTRVNAKVLWGGSNKADVYGSVDFKGVVMDNPIIAPDEYSSYRLKVIGMKDNVGLDRIDAVSKYMREHGLPTEFPAVQHKVSQVRDVTGNLVPVEQWKRGQIEYFTSEVEHHSKNKESVEYKEAVKKLSDVEKYLAATDFYVVERHLQVDERLRDLVHALSERDFRTVVEPIFKWVNVASDSLGYGIIPDTAKPPKFEYTQNGVKQYFGKWLPEQMGIYLARLHGIGLVHGFAHAQNWSLVGTMYDLDSVLGLPTDRNKYSASSREGIKVKDIKWAVGSFNEVYAREKGYLGTFNLEREAQVNFIRSYIREAWGNNIEVKELEGFIGDYFKTYSNRAGTNKDLPAEVMRDVIQSFAE